MKKWILFFFCCSTNLVTEAQTTALHNSAASDNYFYLYRANDDQIKNIPDVHLVPVKTILMDKPNWTIVLTDAHIYPDAEAYHLIYNLNPGLVSLRNSGSGSYWLPAFDPETKLLLTKEKANGFDLVVTTDFSLKTELFKTMRLISQYDEQTSSRKITGADSLGISLQLRIVKTGLDTLQQRIGGRRIILDKESLSRINSETILFYQLQNRPSLGTPDLQKLKDLDEDLILLNETLKLTRGPNEIPETYPAENVTANVKSHTGKLVKGLRVYYVPKALSGDSSAFKQISVLSSPATARLPVANYIFWAGTPGNPQTLTDKLPVNLRKQQDGKPYPVELSLMAANP